MSCHHIWMQKAKDEVSVVNGVTTTRYTHECPHCGKVKVTVRASRALPPELKWKRELEKLMLRAKEEGFCYVYPRPHNDANIGGETPLAIDLIQVLPYA